MKESRQIRNIRCEDIEELLIRQNFEDLTGNEKSLLQEHVKTCNQCRNYQHQLVNFQNSMTISQKSPLRPDPGIRQTVMDRMNALKPKKYRIFDSLWQRLLHILEYRIPVYQGLIGIACSLLFFVVINYFSFSNQPQSGSSQYHKMMADTTFHQINVIKNLQIIEQQKIGKNVSEDTLLTRFIFSTM
ncbi:MAG: hypothetical protein JSW07_13120 [bacterium]|nr:MAG: hypothetical protein JSW07_13120 [bacterium]